MVRDSLDRERERERERSGGVGYGVHEFSRVRPIEKWGKTEISVSHIGTVCLEYRGIAE